MKKKAASKIKKNVPLRIRLSPLGTRHASTILAKQAEELFPFMFSSGGLRREMTSAEKKTYVEVLTNTTPEERKLLAHVARLLRDQQRRMSRALVR